MKNIVLFGVPRSGKTTFSKMILKEFSNYSVLNSDMIFDAYIHTMRKVYNLPLSQIRSKIDMNFTRALIPNIFNEAIDYDKELNFILDIHELSWDEVLKYHENDNILIIVFGYPNVTLESKLDEIKKYETTDDWTFTYPSDVVKEIIKDDGIKQSKIYKNDCQKYNIKFVDTSFKREKVLLELMNWLKEQLN